MIRISTVALSQLPQLQKIGEQTFIETFAKDNTPENMQLYVQQEFSVDTLQAQLLDAHTSFYFAEMDNKIIGYLKLSDAQKNSLEIERIYVQASMQAKGIGQLLLDHAINIAKQIGANFIWLGVWEHNPKAIRFYKKNNFEAFDAHIFQLGNDAQTDILMKLPL
jgi:diamine N-acetyltransferase